MNSRPMLLGEAPGRATGAPFSGRSGARIAALLGIAPDDLRARFELANLLERRPGPGSGGGSAFPAAEARAAAAALDLSGRRVVAFGARVASALGVSAGLLDVVEHRGATVLVFPHPSGASRWWNDPVRRDRAADALRAFLPLDASAADRVRPSGAWTFGGEVADAFDEMLERSVPDYRRMRRTVTALARRYARPGTWVVDLGAARGEAVADLVGTLPAGVRFVGCEVSKPMLAACRARFAEDPTVEVLELDLRTGYPHRPASVTLAVLTVQFVPIEHRQRVLRDAFRSTVPGGVLLLVEKVLGSDAEVDEALVDLHHAEKMENGYSPDDVRRKRFSLEGVLVPVTAAWNEQLLHGAGFDSVECVWRCLNFAAWVAVRRA